MRIGRRGLALAAWLGFAAPSLAAEATIPPIQSTGDLADLCANGSRDLCVGFTLGVITVAERLVLNGSPKLFCTPYPFTEMQETVDTFVQVTKALPATRSAPVVDGLIRFLQQRFPCKS